MAEIKRSVLAKERSVLEYWRHRYLLQAVFVGAFLCGGIFLILNYVSVVLVQIVLILGAVLIANLMFKELREDLQVRGEGLVLAKAKELFGDLNFDYACGSGVVENLSFSGMDKYSVRECKNVILGKGFVLEEDRMYTLLSSEFLPIANVAFEGVILTIECDNPKAKVNNVAVRQALEKVKLLLKANRMYVALGDDTVGFYFATKQPIYYQFQLLGTNVLGKFVNRVEIIKKAVEDVLYVLKK